MPTATYTSLATVTLASSASSVSFSSIPASYRDLILVARHSRSAVSGLRARVNGDSGNNYSAVRAIGEGGGITPGSDSYSGLSAHFIGLINFSANTELPVVLQFMDYSATDKHKTMLARVNSAANGVGMDAHRWANTAAINSILVYTESANFNTGSVFSLYGIAA